MLSGHASLKTSSVHLAAANFRFHAAKATSGLISRLDYEFAASALRAAFYRFKESKAGFRPDQLRWPKGSGENSGRWAGGDALVELVGGRRGHHIVPRSVARSPEFSLSEAARKVFERETTGPLYGARHLFDQPHRDYITAVAQELRDFIYDRRVTGSAMTAQDAEDFLDRIYRSKNPTIQRYNLDLYHEKIKRILRLRIWLRGLE